MLFFFVLVYGGISGYFSGPQGSMSLRPGLLERRAFVLVLTVGGGMCFLLTLLLVKLDTYSGTPGFGIRNRVGNTRSGVLCLRTSKLSNVMTLSSTGLNDDKDFDFTRGHPRSPRFCHLHLSGGIVGFTMSSARAMSIGTRVGSFTATCHVRNSRGGLGVGRLILLRTSLRGGISGLNRGHGVPTNVTRSDLLTVMGGCGGGIGQRCVFTTPGVPCTCFTLFRSLGKCVVFSPLAGGRSIGYFTTITADLGGTCPRTSHSHGLCGVIVGKVGGAHAPHRRAVRVPRSGVGRTDVVSVRLGSLGNGAHDLASLGNGIILVSFAMCGGTVSTTRGLTLHRLCGGCTSRKFRVCRVSLSNSRRF